MNVTIAKKEYLSLKKDANAYRKLISGIFQKTISDKVSNVVQDFENTKLYSDDFLKDLESGLSKSSFGK